MKRRLPDDHGLSSEAIELLVPHADGAVSITDVQYESLEAGVARGQSLLVVSPTSTGKTNIALWAMASRLSSGGKVVYLVTHRALARQKFEEFSQSPLLTSLEGDKSRIVLATGDEVIAGDGLPPRDPLQADILVCTYEKYLAILAGLGVPSALSGLCVVCDEVQLVGDAHRGQNVEILLTLLRNSGWGQLVALSAVLGARDASELADWLGVQLIHRTEREKHLRYEIWTPTSISWATTERPGSVHDGLPLPILESGCIQIVRWLLTVEGSRPIIVFCMKKDDATSIARALVDNNVLAEQEQLSFDFLDMPATAANSLLRQSLTRRVAVHSADLTDEERREVERSLLERKIDVVCATSSLAAGVNFPLGTAVFYSWKRWNFAARQHDPIEPSEFHNMAGRVGRMGFDHEQGRVICCAASFHEQQVARSYLDLDRVEPLVPRIDPSHFSLLVLQLVASGICSSTDTLIAFLSNTFSGLREADRNATAFAAWPAAVETALRECVLNGLVLTLPDSRVVATPIGKVAAHTGLQPVSCRYLLANVLEYGEVLASWLPSQETPGDPDAFLFLVARICFGSPEFSETLGARQTRFFPWPLQDKYVDGVNVRVAKFNRLSLPISPSVLNASSISCDWANGSTYSHLESLARSLSAGMIRELVRNASWVMRGFANLLLSASDPTVPESLRPDFLRGSGVDLFKLRRLPRAVEQLIRRLDEGLPEDVLWMRELNSQGERFKLSREDILRLRTAGLRRPVTLMDGSASSDAMRAQCFPSARPSPLAKANWLRDRVKTWKSGQRQIAAKKQALRAARCPQKSLVERFYSTLGVDFEVAFADVLTHLGVRWQRLDDRSVVGAPDYLVWLRADEPLVFELKTREQDRLVDYNRAVEILAASEIHGFGESFCVTLCHPGVDPSVPGVIASCGRLCVVESHDLGEALLRVCEGELNFVQLHSWLTVPGQSTASDLPYRDRSLD